MRLETATASTGSTPIPDRAKNDYWIVSNQNNLIDSRIRKPALKYFWSYDCGGRPLRPRPVGETYLSTWIDKNAPTCVVVLGACNRFKDVVAMAPQMSAWLRSSAPVPNQPLNVVFFSWPSARVLPTESVVPIEPFLIPFGIAVLDRRSETQGLFWQKCCRICRITRMSA